MFARAAAASRNPSMTGWASRASEGLTLLRRRAVALALAAAGVALVFGISESAYQSATGALDAQHRRIGARTELQTVLRQLIDAETSQRGYVLTGRKEYLEPYERAVGGVAVAVRSLASYYEGDAAVQPLIERLSRQVDEKLSEVATTIKMFDEGRPDAWRELMLSNIGKEKMDEIRSTARSLFEIESARISTERASVLHTLQLGRIGVNALAALSLIALVLYLRQSAALERAQRRHAQGIEAERDQLEVEVSRRTAELIELAGHLQTAQEDERSHLARELHDELGALLTAAKLDAARLERSLGKLAVDVGERLHHLVKTMDEGIALKRRIIEDLRPSSLDNLGLVAALEILVREFGRRSQTRASAELVDVELSPGAQLTVYRMVQEALTNVAKYAKATTVTVSMRPDGGRVRVSVHDDGCGFDLAAARPSAHGLVGMRYRVQAAGGRLRIVSQPGHGTVVAASLPGLEPAGDAPGSMPDDG
jgi:signal transduction histidine kinase